MKARFFWPVFLTCCLVTLAFIIKRENLYTHDIDIRHVFKYVRLETKKINDKDCSCLTVPEIFEGEWVQSSNISPLRKYYFTQLNMKYRRKINTSDLIRKDGKCGTRNPVGR